jgi:hypothetical protein
MHALAFVIFMLGFGCCSAGVLVFVIGVVNLCFALILMLAKGIRAMFGCSTGAPSGARKESIGIGKGFLNLGIGVALIAIYMLLFGIAHSLTPDLDPFSGG